ncbi:MAG: DUF169 domain-containing protein [Desulfobacterales bacterium]|nr:DUF169 domain-containing protein [Desulfobacterales bacterium]
MTEIKSLYNDIINSMGVKDLEIPLTAVKIFRDKNYPPENIKKYILGNLTLTSCQAAKQAALGDNVCLNRDNIGCIAAAITFGLVDSNQKEPMTGSRVYTDIMKDQSGKDNKFKAPSPKDFTDGLVYACKDAGKPDFALFGSDDSGRYKDVETAKKAIKDMLKLEPANTNAVFFYNKDLKDFIEPDIIVLSVRPVELIRLIQAFQYITGERVTSSMGGIRVVNSDLIVRPFLEQKINISSYCLGARLIGQYDANRLGMGIPYNDFKVIARGMVESKTGFPFHLYPGSDESAI